MYLRAQAGQLMEINVTPENPENNLQLIIYGVDGSVLRSGMGEGSTFRGELPFSEDYIVTVTLCYVLCKTRRCMGRLLPAIR